MTSQFTSTYDDAQKYRADMQALLDELPPALQPGKSNIVKEEKIKLERTHEKQKVGKAELPTWDEFLIDIAIMLNLKDVTGQKTKTAAPKEINIAEMNKGSYKGALTGKGKGGRTNTTPGNTGKGKGEGRRGRKRDRQKAQVQRVQQGRRHDHTTRLKRC